MVLIIPHGLLSADLGPLGYSVCSSAEEMCMDAGISAAFEDKQGRSTWIIANAICLTRLLIHGRSVYEKKQQGAASIPLDSGALFVPVEPNKC